jgi:Zn-dependent peptidase ImmA (M78 family)
MDELVVDHEVGELRVALSWTHDGSPRSTAAEVTRGRLLVEVRGQPVWHDSTGRRGFEWTWIELLEFLGWAWPYLLLEDGTPMRVRIDTAPRMLAAAEAAISEHDIGIAGGQDDLVYGYVETHDLSLGLEGALLPPLWIVRQGTLGWVSSAAWHGAVPFDELVDALKQVGDAISARIADVADDRARQARAQWFDREQLSRTELIRAATGYSSDLVAEIEDSFLSADERDWTELRSDELLAAARSLGPLSSSVLMPILQAVRESPLVNTDLLDGLATTARAILSHQQDDRLYEQGYALANWLRSVPGFVSTAGRVDPDGLLQTWGIPVLERELALADLDAIGCWGPRYGPAIVLNIDGVHNKTASGRRVTLAHEIAHLLVDRDVSLPLVEVLAGQTPETIEVRARAFAAELLLPRNVAAEVLQSAPSVDRARRTAVSRFGISAEIFAWQVKNSGTPLTDQEITQLRGLVSRPSAYT